MRNYRLLWPYVRRYQVSFAIGGLLILVSTIISLLQPYLLRIGVDALQNNTATVGFLGFVSGVIVLVALVQLVLGYWQRYLINRRGWQIEYQLRADLFKKFQTLDRGYYDETPIGDIMVRSTSDITMIRQMLNQSVSQITSAILLTIFALALMFLQDWKLAIVGILCLPLLTVAFSMIGGKVENFFRSAQEQLGDITNRVQEVFAGIRVVKAYNRERLEDNRFLAENNEYLTRNLKVARLNALLFPLVTLALGLTTVLLIWVGSGEVTNGDITIGQFIQFNAYLLLLAPPLAILGQTINLVQTATASLGRLQEIFLIQPAVDNPQKPQAESKEKASDNGATIEFQSVSLRYNGNDNYALENLTMTIPAGETVAIVGPTGSGKSSISALLGRVYDPTKGSILLNGQDIRQLPLQTLRDRIVYVPQETLLFSLPLRDNIAFGDPVAEAEAIVEATRLSRLSQDLPQIPGGLTALVGERGVTLSGGQKQRAAIARAILPDSTVLILDDALSSVDARTQNRIATNLREVARGRTTIIVSQRLALVRDADHIFVLDDGRLVEQGNHQQLLDEHGLYARMYEREIAAAEHFEIVDDIVDNIEKNGEIEENVAEPEIDLESLKNSRSAADVTLEAIASDMETRFREKKPKQRKTEDVKDEMTGTAGAEYNGPRLFGLVRYIKPYWKLALISLPVILIASLADLAGPYLIKVAIDSYIVPRKLDGINLIIFAYLAITIVSFVFRYGRSYLMQLIGQYVVRDLRVQLFGHFLKQSLSFFDHNAVGRLMTRLTSDVDSINDLLSQGAVAVVGDVVTLIGIVITMILLDWRLALVSFAVLPILAVVSFIFRQYVRRIYRTMRVRSSALNSYMAENYNGMLVVQLFNRQQENFKELDQLNAAYRESGLAFVKANGLFLPFVTFLASLAGALLLFFGGWGIISNIGITFGLLVAFQQYTDRAFTPIRDLAQNYTTFSAATVSTERIFSLLAQKPAIEDVPNPEKLPEGREFKGAISFDHVNFSYDGEHPVLRDVSFHIKPGQNVAIVGRTGAGKTSIISLLCHFYDIQSGKITLDNHDIREVGQNDLRRHVSLVLQDPVMFSGTIADNIRFGNDDITMEQIKRASEQVGADTFINRLPGGYDYQLRERGSNLSAGQRQLISFARAIAYNPNAILIMDEATANVDTESEAIIQTALDKLLEGRTSIVIAHRLSTIKNADLVIVMEQGRIAEMGGQEELVAQRGFYYQLIRNQYRQTSPTA